MPSDTKPNTLTNIKPPPSDSNGKEEKLLISYLNYLRAKDALINQTMCQIIPHGWCGRSDSILSHWIRSRERDTDVFRIAVVSMCLCVVYGLCRKISKHDKFVISFWLLNEQKSLLSFYSVRATPMVSVRVPRHHESLFLQRKKTISIAIPLRLRSHAGESKLSLGGNDKNWFAPFAFEQKFSQILDTSLEECVLKNAYQKEIEKKKSGKFIAISGVENFHADSVHGFSRRSLNGNQLINSNYSFLVFWNKFARQLQPNLRMNKTYERPSVSWSPSCAMSTHKFEIFSCTTRYMNYISLN